MYLFGYAATLPDPPAKRAFDGESYEPGQDHKRLRAQLVKLKTIMSDGGWHTLDELALELGCKEQSASARIRDLRKSKYGAHVVKRERIEGGLFRYQLQMGTMTSGVRGDMATGDQRPEIGPIGERQCP